jgi:glyoxylase-like metal-dependent hydrolase (beta-lactamase superfamily II)
LSWALVDAGWSGSEQTIQAAAESVFGPGARPASVLLTHLHPDHSGSIRRLAEYWGQAAYVHPDELPLASGCFAEYAMPLRIVADPGSIVPSSPEHPRPVSAELGRSSEASAGRATAPEGS